MLEMYLKEPSFTYSACSPFTKNKERIESLCKLEIQILFTNISLIKPVFCMIMAYGKSKDLVKRTQSDKVLRDKACKIASDLKFGCQRG